MSEWVKLTAAEQLGKDLFFDHTLSDPQGYSCASCHVPETGFTGPRSDVNEFSGPMPGVMPGRFGHRKPQAVTSAVCPSSVCTLRKSAPASSKWVA